MKKFRVHDTLKNEYLVNSADLFLCANGKIFHRQKDEAKVIYADGSLPISSTAGLKIFTKEIDKF